MVLFAIALLKSASKVSNEQSHTKLCLQSTCWTYRLVGHRSSALSNPGKRPDVGESASTSSGRRDFMTGAGPPDQMFGAVIFSTCPAKGSCPICKLLAVTVRWTRSSHSTSRDSRTRTVTVQPTTLIRPGRTKNIAESSRARISE